MNIKLTVFFDEPFWIGVFERIENGLLQTARVVFGPEPKDYEVYYYVLNNMNNLSFGSPILADESQIKKINPKRLQRIIHKEVESKGICTKAQLSIKQEIEARKFERKGLFKERKEDLKELKFQLKQDKKKIKKKGH